MSAFTADALQIGLAEKSGLGLVGAAALTGSGRHKTGAAGSETNGRRIRLSAMIPRDTFRFGRKHLESEGKADEP
jgi:hypothetical protein